MEDHSTHTWIQERVDETHRQLIINQEEITVHSIREKFEGKTAKVQNHP